MGKKVAIITGSATGVGAATAILLAQKDCNVVINYTRSENEAFETAKIAEKHGAETIVFQADVSKDEECQAMVSATMKKWGQIDYLVNNAGRTKFNFFENLDGLTMDLSLIHI